MHWFRWLHLGVATALLGVVAGFSLSDSILGPVRTGMLAAFALARAVEAELGVDLGNRASLPVALDTLGHFLGWMLVAIVIAGLTASWPRRTNLFLALFALSALFEIGQHFLARNRSAEVTDLLGNGAGLALGFLAYAAFEAAIGTRRLLQLLGR